MSFLKINFFSFKYHSHYYKNVISKHKIDFCFYVRINNQCYYVNHDNELSHKIHAYDLIFSSEKWKVIFFSRGLSIYTFAHIKLFMSWARSSVVLKITIFYTSFSQTTKGLMNKLLLTYIYDRNNTIFQKCL